MLSNGPTIKERIENTDGSPCPEVNHCFPLVTRLGCDATMWENVLSQPLKSIKKLGLFAKMKLVYVCSYWFWTCACPSRKCPLHLTQWETLGVTVLRPRTHLQMWSQPNGHIHLAGGFTCCTLVDRGNHPDTWCNIMLCCCEARAIIALLLWQNCFFWHLEKCTFFI